MKTITFKVTGLTPLLMHNPAAMSARSKGPSAKTIPSPEEEAERSVYKTEKGVLCIPSMNFRASLLAGAKGMRMGKFGAIGILSGAINIDEGVCELFTPNGKEKPIRKWTIDTRRAVVQRQGILRSRARVNEWATRITWECAEEFMKPEAVEELFARAGVIAGIGDFRPERRGPFGKYRVELEKID